MLVTAARDEEKYIGFTLAAVVSQTILPAKWIIVDDSSEDHTRQIVESYSCKHEFIKLVSIDSQSDRSFGAKAGAVMAGTKCLRNLQYDYIGNLDADMSFKRDYYEKVLSKFRKNPNLGIAGGIRYDNYKGKFRRVRCAVNSVSGAFQLFRQDCFEAVGGYVNSGYGGIDTIAETMARMYGWQVRSFPELELYHHRCTGTASRGLLGAQFRDGIKNYVVGYHPLFQLLRMLRGIDEKPFIISSLFWMAGYYWSAIRRYPRPVSEEFVNYLRKEQLSRLKTLDRRGSSSC